MAVEGLRPVSNGNGYSEDRKHIEYRLEQLEQRMGEHAVWIGKVKFLAWGAAIVGGLLTVMLTVAVTIFPGETRRMIAGNPAPLPGVALEAYPEVALSPESLALLRTFSVIRSVAASFPTADPHRERYWTDDGMPRVAALEDRLGWRPTRWQVEAACQRRACQP